MGRGLNLRCKAHTCVYVLYVFMYLFVYFLLLFLRYFVVLSFSIYCTLNILQLLLISIYSYIYLLFATYTTRCAWKELQYFSLHCSNVFMIFSILVFSLLYGHFHTLGCTQVFSFVFSSHIFWISFSILPPVALVASTFVNMFAYICMYTLHKDHVLPFVIYSSFYNFGFRSQQLLKFSSF